MPPTARRRRPPRTLLVALLAIAAWGGTPPWTGPPLGLGIPAVPLDIEILSHAVPSVVVVGAAVAGLLGRLPLPAALLAVLGGLWMTATHAPLVVQGVDGRVPMDAALFHSLPTFAVLALTVAVTVWVWRDEARTARQRSPARAPTRAERG